MLPRVVDARHAQGYRVWLKFADGSSGEIDLTDQLSGPIFEPLRDVELFATFRVDADLDTITWPNGADFSPEWLLERLKSSTHSKAAAE